MIISLYVFVIILVLSIPSAVIFIPLAVVTGNVRPLYAVVCFIVRTGFRAAGIRVRVEGRENVPAGQACIFMANHVSNLDPPALIPRIPGRTAAFAKRALFNLPVFGYCLKLGSFIPVDRTGSAHTAQESVGAAKRVLEQGVHITTFVEGTRSKDGPHAAFQKGHILPGDADRRAVHSGFDLRDGDADVERQLWHQAGNGAHHFPCARKSWRYGHP